MFIQAQIVSPNSVSTQTPEEASRQQAFRNRVSSDRVRGSFDTPEEVALNVVTALRNWEQERDDIVLGDPIEYPNEYVNVSSGHLTYRLYRVPVTSVGRDAANVRVQLAKSTPPLAHGLPNPVLHLAGDNPPDRAAFVESKGFSLSRGVARTIDVIAVTKASPDRCFIFSIASPAAMEEHDDLNGRYVFQLAASGGSMRDYVVEVDLDHGKLSMITSIPTKSTVADDFWLEPGAPRSVSIPAWIDRQPTRSAF
jgi:hypothetical protein